MFLILVSCRLGFFQVAFRGLKLEQPHIITLTGRSMACGVAVLEIVHWLTESLLYRVPSAAAEPRRRHILRGHQGRVSQDAIESGHQVHEIQV